MDENEDWKQWFRLAGLDLSVAEHLHKNMYPTPDEPICFHCQQSAEKYLKGFLVFNEIEPPKTHNLPILQEMCKEISANFSKLFKKCVFLNKFGTLPRYPNDLEITAEDVHVILCYAKEIKEFVVNICN
jgi:HEPN domain-containing protein